MTTVKKRILLITCLCVLFLAAAFITFLSLGHGNLFPPAAGEESVPEISFPQHTVTARAEFESVTIDGMRWYHIEMEFPNETAAKELYKTEEWANNYQYNTQIQLAPWFFKASYQLKDGSTVTRKYRKSGQGEVLAEFIKTHEQYITKKIKDYPNE